jgi:hypothetical protein
MNDYLSNLVARSFALGEVVQPRPVSLFEPIPVPSMPAFEDIGSLETDKESVSESPNYDTHFHVHDLPEQYSLSPRSIVNEENESLEARNSPLPTPTQKEEQGSPRELQSSQSAPITTSLSNPVPKSHRDRSTTQPLRSLLVTPAKDIGPSFEPVIRQGEGEQDALSSGSTETIRGEANEEPVTPPKERKSRLGLEPILPHMVVSSIDASSTEMDEGHPTAETAPPAVERGKRSHPQPPNSSPGALIPPAITPVVARPRAKSNEGQPSQNLTGPAGSPEATPTVHVTIGRVEVRATPPPNPPQKVQRNRAPIMSLDEYLRQRTQESRR